VEGTNCLSFDLAAKEGTDAFVSWYWNCMQWILFDSVISSGKIFTKKQTAMDGGLKANDMDILSACVLTLDRLFPVYKLERVKPESC